MDLHMNIRWVPELASLDFQEISCGGPDPESATMPKIIQVNINHCAQAQDLLCQEMAENNIGVAIVAEPYRIPDATNWLADAEGHAAIIWNPSAISTPCILVNRGEGFVVAKVGNLTIVSCYVSPNIGLPEFEATLHDMALEIQGSAYKYLIVAGDLNAKAKTWGSHRENARGEILQVWAGGLELRLVNVGDIPTCVRHNGTSIIDLTWASPNLVTRIKDWQVLSEKETLSDHKYITYYVSLGKTRERRNNTSPVVFPRWVTDRADWDIFAASIHAQELMNPAATDGPQEEAEELQRIVLNACDASMPVSRLKRPTCVHWWNSTIAGLRVECNKARRRLCRARRKEKRRAIDRNAESQHSAESVAINEALDSLRVAKKRLKLEIIRAKKHAWLKLIDTLQKDPWGKPYRIVLNKLRRSLSSATETMEELELSRTLNELFPNPPNRESDAELTAADLEGGSTIPSFYGAQGYNGVRENRYKGTRPRWRHQPNLEKGTRLVYCKSHGII